ncbi:hypothetical protein [Acinetobacter sp.]|uniref:hypothetical protein n=1 Tax=Acinetobacter sp. TaxID=472 RepID=UPI00388FB23D
MVHDDDTPEWIEHKRQVVTEARARLRRSERAEFETWAKENLGQGYPLTMDEGVYENVVTRWAFIAWKAGRSRR